MSDNDRSISFLAGWAGFLAVAIAIAGIIGAALVSGWQYGINSLSDLGVMSPTASFFNYCLVIAGVLMIVHGSVRGPTEVGAHKYASCMIGFAGVFLMLGGAFTVSINGGTVHDAAWDIFAVLLVIAMIFEGIAGRNEGLRGIIVGGLGALSIVVIAVTYFLIDDPKFAIIAAACIFIWFGANTYGYMLNGVSFKKVAA